jgi:isopentenyldiphosphate isomerase
MMLCSNSVLSRLLISGSALTIRNGGGVQLSASSRLIHHNMLMMNAVSISDDDSGNYKLAQDPSELFDIYPSPPTAAHFNSIIRPDWGEEFFPVPQPTGRVKKRSQVHKDGDWHRSMHLWIYQPDSANENVRVLLQRRSPYKDTHPNLLDVSCAGHVNAGDDILETTMREMEEELGGNGNIKGRYSLEDVKNSRMFTVTSAIEGETEKHGKYVCREYQDVFILKWKGHVPMESNDFSPMVKEEVSGFEIIGGQELINKLRQGDKEFVPRSAQYIDALANVFGC